MVLFKLVYYTSKRSSESSSSNETRMHPESRKSSPHSVRRNNRPPHCFLRISWGFLFFLSFQYPALSMCNLDCYDISDMYIFPRKIDFLEVPCPSTCIPCIIEARHENHFRTTKHQICSPNHRFTEEIIQDFPSSRLLDRRNIVWKLAWSRPRTRRISRDICEVKITLSHRLRCRLEFCFCLSWKTDDNIGRNRKEWITRTEILKLCAKILICMLAIHAM